MRFFVKGLEQKCVRRAKILVTIHKPKDLSASDAQIIEEITKRKIISMI